MLVVVCGLQGVGKTEVAKYISGKTRSLLLRTDVIRKELIANPTYTPEEMQQIYEEMFERAKTTLESRSVVLDATFAKRVNREQARAVSENAKKEFRLVEVVCPNDEIIRKRLEQRAGDASDARFAQYLNSKALFERITESHITIYNSSSIEYARSQVDKYF